MTPRRNKRALTALLAGAAIAAGIPAFGQDAPESLLPPGFGDPVQPAPAPAPGAQPVGPQPASLLPPDVAAAAAKEGEQAEEEQEEAEEFELPDAARRPIDVAGQNEGYGLGAFGRADGPYLSTLMRRMNAPLPSRWASIMLRRALLTRVPTPRGVNPADWIAERAWLLLRMGEADAARILVQGVDVDRFTPKLYAVAAQTALATADPAGLCPLVDGAILTSREPIWPMAQAICAALSGEAAISSTLFDRARQGRDRRGIDVLLAEKVIGAGTNSRRAVVIDWTGYDRLTAWRFGLANAVAVQIPDSLLQSAPPQVRAWQARAPMLTPTARIATARTAAALGIFSNAGLVDLYGASGDENDDFGLETPAGRLRAAYAGDDDEARLSALRELWEGDDKAERERYADLVLTARAAARIAPSSDHADDSAKLIAAMFAAGLDRQAARWAKIAEDAGRDTAEAAWAILAVGTPRPVVDVSYSRLSRFADHAGSGEGAHKARLLAAAMAGLGRIGGKDRQRIIEDLGVPLDAQNNWTRALDRAVAGREQGTVILLCAAGMQTGDWRGVPAASFYRIISALHRVGLDGEARMIAAEAMSRL